MSAPQQKHLDVVKHILRYVGGTMHCGLYYKAGAPVAPEGFTDSAYLSCVKTRRSTGGYLFQLAGNSSNLAKGGLISPNHALIVTNLRLLWS